MTPTTAFPIIAGSRQQIRNLGEDRIHLARKGNLTLEELHKRFIGPSRVLDFAARAGRIGTLQMNSTSCGDPHDR